MPRRATSAISPFPQAVGVLGFALILATACLGRGQELLARLPEVVFAPSAHSVPAYTVEHVEHEHGRQYDTWDLQVLPDGLLYHSYLAGTKEPRFAMQWFHETNAGWLADAALGGRMGLLRYGTRDPLRPEGWQIDVEGGALPRINLEEDMDLMAVDFRVGSPLTYARGPYRMKLGYYHLSSHLGDELMLEHPGVPRINFSRDSIIWGHSYYWTDEIRLYGEAAWAFHTDGGTRPWEFQFGVEYRPSRPTGLRPTPFLAVNGHLREELDFGGNLSIQTGWLWRGERGHLFRIGMAYYTGMSDQFEFFDRYEDKVGLGIWYDY
ncbi:MAG: DUF1207 domain-containing protein [Pirellulales bacterium]|nr:DUF1207 domain-containing protein [Pirellulales bacterium]